jgi:hypothetical protein
MHTRPITVQVWKSVLNQLIYHLNAPKVAHMQAAVAKQGYEAKIALDAVHEMIDSTTKFV